MDDTIQEMDICHHPGDGFTPPSSRWISHHPVYMDMPLNLGDQCASITSSSQRWMCHHPAEQMDNEIMHHEGLFFFSPSIIQHHSNQQYIYTVCYVWYESRFYLLTSCFFFFLQRLPQSRFWDELRSYQEFDEQFVPTRAPGLLCDQLQKIVLRILYTFGFVCYSAPKYMCTKMYVQFGRGTEEPFARVASVTAVAKTWACTLSRDRGASPTAIIVMAFSRYRLATGMFWRSINSTK